MDLKGRIAVVTGASRGVGKGIAIELGRAGATVYVTGRSVEPGPLPGTIHETAEEVTAAGGVGISVACDHRDDEQIAALFARVAFEQAGLDILVNNVFSAPDLAQWVYRPFWELPVHAWDQVVGLGTRAHYVASVHAVQLMSAGGLIVNVSSSGASEYQQNVVYGVGKAATDKMTADMAVDLKPRDIAVFSIWPGLVRTEFLLAAARTVDGRQVLDFPDGRMFDVSHAESPRFIGRGVAGLATDPARIERSGGIETTSGLAARYGFTDTDGSTPPVSTEIR
ncbi:SDR family NAD(P)-dependent oxidoreductase [Kutzneria buriramensis]|uniref:NAD(P)-dependent dehydrogenase (Short-subunit alcohol dehydrogenase family) n=1 Tax=Kutzneria buriramensis TaxID=1045776 RepID=A0A3E0GW67_9PSEU|nr:SDR family NAD(P)-dependent oxidoreductase [Kutzneria buriramensis]REH28509.1 NAD(P)-dependent dehydrogenase (short-subunit alcohol dehydrogenase family) [Kutzneria buriramensis]